MSAPLAVAEEGAAAVQAPALGEDARRRLRLWLRLLHATRSTEAQLRDYLRREHGTTLPRFDVMAALARREAPMAMGELASMLLVSNGNATDVVGRLEAEGLVRRAPRPGWDRGGSFCPRTWPGSWRPT